MVEPGRVQERRPAGLLRVPFVRRCLMDFDDGASSSAFLVNINVLGAYLAVDKEKMPSLGQAVMCHFNLPDSEREVVARGVVAWLNPRQQHPVHSLPPGIGVKFLQISPEDQGRIERLVEEYVSRQTRGRTD